MKETERFVLMHRNDEVLSFDISFDEDFEAEIKERRSGFAKAPFGMDPDAPLDQLNRILYGFLRDRAIPITRWDHQEILKYTGAKNLHALSFMGHGLSLSNHYWYKKEGECLRYEDINFFTNKWDDRFAKCVLKGDYESLRDVSLLVPDLVTPGWGVKGWLCEEDGPRLYKFGIAKGHDEEAIAETLSSRFARRVFSPGDVLEYELKEINGRYASVSKGLIGVDEELIPLSSVLPSSINALYRARHQDRNATKEFFQALDQCDIPGLREFFVKIAVFRSLCFVNDLHFDNLSVIRNIDNGQIKLAPIFDIGSSFGSSEKARRMLSSINKATYLIVYFLFGDLDPNWDYSWYSPESLDGFEDEIREYLSKGDFYTEALMENIIDVYHHQKDSLDALAKK